MKRIDISTPKYPSTFTIVDDADYEWLNQWKWQAVKSKRTFYAVRTVWMPGGKMKDRQKITMHRLILGLGSRDKRQGDHRNHNGLANWRDNLRTCTCSQNKQNGNPYRNCSSKYKGVSWRKDCRKWVARIRVDGCLVHLGLYGNEIEAAKAYNKAARELFGEFASLNEIMLEVGEAEVAGRKVNVA